MIRIVFSCLLIQISGFFLAVLPASAQDSAPVSAPLPVEDPYTVSGVQVDLVDESSAKARDKAFLEAQKKAFSVLAERFGQAGKTVPADQLAGMVDDFGIDQERFSSKRYKGRFTVRFRKSSVDNILGGELPSVETGSSYPVAQGAVSPVDSSADSSAPSLAPAPIPPAAEAKPLSPVRASPFNFAATPGTVRVKTSYASLADWVRLQGLLKNTPSVASYKTVSVTVRAAEFDLSYKDWTAFMAELSRQGYRLQALPGGVYQIYR